VISANVMGNVPVKVVVPLRTWQDRFKNIAWLVPVAATAANGLKRNVAADVMQVKSFDTGKFDMQQGRLTAET
jgi:mRNA interferase MazF